MNGRIRVAGDADFEAFFSSKPPPVWLGIVHEKDGEVTAFGSVVWEEWGHAIVFYHCREKLSRFTMQRAAKRVIGILRSVGEPAVYSVPDKAIPGAETWLERLGFRPTGYVPPGYSDEVWRLDLNDAAANP